MRIAVIGATGKAGKLIVQEAVNRSHEVTAISRRPHPRTLPISPQQISKPLT